MYQVSTVNLSADATRADMSLGTTDLGERSAAELMALLDRFRGLDGMQNHDSEPHVIIESPAGKFHVRTGQGKLFLYNARTTVEPYAELTASEILAQLDRRADTAGPVPMEGVPDATSSAPPPMSATHRGIAVAILAAGVALNGFTLYSVFYEETVDTKPAVTLVIDVTEATARQREIIGTYATGDRPGDRIIMLNPDGSVRFSEIGAKAGLGGNTDRYQLGKRGAKFCLNTSESGVIDVLNIETLVYYRDTYRRQR